MNFSWLTIVVILTDRGTWNCYRLLDITLRENDTAARRFMYLNGTTPLGYLQVFRYQRTREMYYCEGCYTSQWNHAAGMVAGLPIRAYKKYGLLRKMPYISMELRHLNRYRSSDISVQDNRLLLKLQQRLTGTKLLVSQHRFRYQRIRNLVLVKDTNHLTGTMPLR